MRVFLRLFHPLPHHLDAHDVLKVDPEHVGAIVLFSAAAKGTLSAHPLYFFASKCVGAVLPLSATTLIIAILPRWTADRKGDSRQ